MPSISVRRLFSDNQHKLELAWAAGNSGADNRIGVEADKPVLALVGHLNFIHPNQIQVVGVAEAEYLRRLESGELNYDFGELFDIPMSLVIVANGLPVSPKLRDYCHTNSIPLLTSKQESPHLMDVLRIYLQRTLATSTIKHGVFLDVFEVGVLITGQSGLGKSELALELISRGHSLIADDAVELFRTGPEMLEGRCPPMLRDFLEVRGLGILNIRHIFGETSIRPKKILQLQRFCQIAEMLHQYFLIQSFVSPFKQIKSPLFGLTHQPKDEFSRVTTLIHRILTNSISISYL